MSSSSELFSFRRTKSNKKKDHDDSSSSPGSSPPVSPPASPSSLRHKLNQQIVDVGGTTFLKKKVQTTRYLPFVLTLKQKKDKEKDKDKDKEKKKKKKNGLIKLGLSLTGLTSSKGSGMLISR